MNDHEPFTPDAVDALLSADLDGELDGAAGELGLSASEARERLAATQGVDARRRALTRARDRIARRPAIEPPVEARLVATALAGDDLAAVRERRSSRERQWRVLVAAGSVAAAVAVIVGVSTMDANPPSKSSAALSPGTGRQEVKGAESSQTGPARAQVDFGDVTSEAALRDPALRLLARATTAETSAGIPLSAPQSSGQVKGTKSANDSSFDPASPACTPAALEQYSTTAPPSIIAKGTVEGAPVAILIYDSAAGRYADVVRPSDCSLIRRQSLD